MQYVKTSISKIRYQFLLTNGLYLDEFLVIILNRSSIKKLSFQEEEGWAKGRLKGKEGVFPTNFCALHTENEVSSPTSPKNVDQTNGEVTSHAAPKKVDIALILLAA